MEIIRNHQHGFCLCKGIRVLLFHRHKLIDGVEDLFLYPGPCIQFFLRNELVHLCIHSRSPVVPVSHRITDHPILVIQKYIIHCPGIDPHADRQLSELFTALHSLFDMGK